MIGAVGAASPFASTALADAVPLRSLKPLIDAWGGPQISARVPRGKVLRVAVLDKGFLGFEKEIGRTLPSGTRYMPGPVAAPDDAKTEHGLRMAQLLTDVATDGMTSPRLDLRLYNVFGFTNFTAAITDLIAWKADLVLYSEVWEFGGNFDGRGFINAEVSRAAKAGILWVNAAGNFALGTYNSSIQTSQDDWVVLPDQNKSLAVRCVAAEGKTCSLKAVLSWNDFKDDSNLGTNKDLDFALADDLLNIVQTSTLRQSADPKEERPGYSKYPREVVAATVKPGTYYLRIKNASHNFGANDRLRITVDGDSLVMPSATPEESMLNPADNPSVLTVGAVDADRSSVSLRLGKPDVWGPSSVSLEDGNEFRGSSNTAAFTAGFLALIKLQVPAFGKDRAQAQGVNWNWNQGVPSLRFLGFGPQGGNCFQEGDYSQAPAHIHVAMSFGGKFVATTAGWRIMVPFDPAVLGGGLNRQRADDMIVMTPNGLAVYPRYSMIPSDAIEIFQRPLESGLCRAPKADRGMLFVPR